VLTPDQRKELENLGAATIRFKLLQSGGGRGAAVTGFTCGEISRGDVEDWLVEKNREETALQRTILFWARVAGWTGLVGIGIAAVDWLFKK
jgi:hypothetical protein